MFLYDKRLLKGGYLRHIITLSAVTKKIQLKFLNINLQTANRLLSQKVFVVFSRHGDNKGDLIVIGYTPPCHVGADNSTIKQHGLGKMSSIIAQHPKPQLTQYIISNFSE